MKTVILAIALTLISGIGFGQDNFQWTIKKGTNPNEVDVYIKPNFHFNPGHTPNVYLSQVQFTISWLSNCPTAGQPNLAFTVDPAFNVRGGGNYTSVVFPRGNSISPGNESYYVVSMNRIGDTYQEYLLNEEVKIGTVAMSGSAKACRLRLVDYADLGTDGQACCLVINSQTAYEYRMANQLNLDFYSSATSVAGGIATYGYAEVTQDISLPVKLNSFSGTQENCVGKLDWETAEEVNFSHFEVEQSLDGAAYTKAGTVQAAGGTAAHAYKFSTGTLNGRKYYRLKMVDNDGKYTYSNVVLLTANCGGSGYGAMVYPNPAGKGSDVNVNLHGFTGSISGTLFDAQGRLVNTQTLKNGTNVLSTARLSAGMYHLTLQDAAGNMENKKIIIAQ